MQVLPESGGEYRIRFSLRKNEAEIMLDTSGEGLHKRGYRKQSTLAPIKETLACAMLDLGRIYPTAPCRTHSAAAARCALRRP